MSRKLLAVLAHPDDESFGIGGTLAKYAREGVAIHVLVATRGENGQPGGQLGRVREREIMVASKILGVAQVEFMDFIDGTLSNHLYHDMAGKIEAKIHSFRPHVVVTFDRLGITGHIDHITVSLVTSFVCQKRRKELSLYYYCELTQMMEELKDYFIYVPEGYTENMVDVRIDVSGVWETKVRAMYAHRSQIEDVKWILKYKNKLPKHEYFIKAFAPRKKHPIRSDLFRS